MRNLDNYDEGDLYNEFEAAEYLGLSVHWLRQSRLTVPKWAGPTYVKVDGYHVRYLRADLDQFLANRNGGPVVVNPAERIARAS